ncbi:hypothetical protein ACFSLT_30375 [Novosphingobium resinovorum]
MADAYYDLWNDVRRGVRYGEGYVAFEEILKDKNPLQMKLWYLTCERDLKETVKDMRWLAILANRRAYMARAVRESGRKCCMFRHVIWSTARRLPNWWRIRRSGIERSGYERKDAFRLDRLMPRDAARLQGLSVRTTNWSAPVVSRS